jgi:C-terminal processing protease CtpA/Prc
LNRHLFVTSIAATAFTVPLLGAATTDGLFEPAAMQADLQTFATTIEEVGADPFRTSSRDQFRAALATAMDACSQPLAPAAFYVVAAHLAASLNDGHVSIGGWNGRTEHATRGGGEFPIRCIVDSDEALVVDVDASDSPAIARGTVVTAIDNIPASKIVELAVGLRGGQTAILRRSSARVAEAIYLLCGARAIGSPFHVTYVPPQGSERSVAVAAVRLATITTRNAAAAPPAGPYVDLGITDGIARINYNSCQDREKFGQFLETAFANIRAQKAAAVVVDIRRNSGGASDVNEELFRYVTTKPYRQSGGWRARVSERLRNEYGAAKYASYYGALAARGRDGTIVEYPAAPPRAPRPTDLRFDGPAFLVIGPATFSSAELCAAAAKSFGLMTLVGEETGEPVVSTGEVYSFALSRTGFTAYATTKLFLPPTDLPLDRGVIPDIVTPLTRADRAAGRDPAYEAIRQRLHGSG